MTQNFDVAIAGGGVMGSAVAYFLASDPGFRGRVLVVERDPTYATCATTRSWGGFRQQFSTPENIRMSLFGAAFFREAAERLAVGDERPDLGIRVQGYLFLASAAGAAQLVANVRLQRELGADVELLDPPALAERFPWLARDGLVAGAFGPQEGWIDPHALLHAFRRKAIALGVEYRRDEAVGLERDGRRVTGLRLASGERVAAGTVVNAGGPQAAAIAAMAGLELPVRPRKRMTFVFDCRTDLRAAPLTIDPTGVAFRPEGNGYIGIVSPPEENDPDSADLELDYAPFEETVWPTLAARVPAFEEIKLKSAWAGWYDYNTFDQNALLGPHPEVDGLLFCNGFSGHGIQQSPAAGRAIAELILHGGYRSLDLARFGLARVLEGSPLPEANVV
jgi:sarcosine oxidase